MRQINIQNVHRFAADAIDAASRIDHDTIYCGRFGLPGLELKVRSTDQHYIDLCKTAFVEQPSVKGESDRKISVSVVNRDTSQSMPSVLWDEPEFSIKRMAESLHDNGFEGVFEFDYRLWQFLRNKDGASIQLMQSADAYPPWEAAFPLRQFVHWAYQRSDLLLAHAGTLGLSGTGALLAGSGGSGKSGTVLAAILNGFSTVGDDYVVIGRNGSELCARPVIRLMKQDPEGMKRVGLDPGLKIFGRTNWQNKHVFDYDELLPGCAAGSLKLNSILLPRITRDAKTSIRRANGREALLALAPSSLYQLKGGWSNTMKLSSQICRELPAYHLELSENPQEIAGTLREFLRDLSP